MKRILPLFLTLSVVPQAFAADVPAPASVTSQAPVIDPAAAALLDKSASTYGALTGFAAHFATTQHGKGKPVKTSGEIALARPGKAKVEMINGKTKSLYISDGQKFWSQLPTDPPSYKVEDATPGSPSAAVSRMNTPLGLPFSFLIDGRNILDLGYKWQSVAASPGGAVKLTTLPSKTSSATVQIFTLTFDPASSLLKRAEVATTSRGKTSTTTTVFSNVQANATFVPATFTYAPGDVKPYIEPPPFDARLVVGAEPFPLATKDLEGKVPSWKKYRGKVVLLDFWATWCGPCMAEMPNVLKNYDKYHEQGFDVIGISLDEEKDALTAMIKARDIKYTNLFDEEGKRSNPDAKNYGVRFIPFTLLIGKDGKIAAVNEGGERLEQNIVAALAK